MALVANVAGAYVIAPRMREVAVAPPPAAKKEKSGCAAKAPKGTRTKKVKAARSRAR